MESIDSHYFSQLFYRQGRWQKEEKATVSLVPLSGPTRLLSRVAVFLNHTPNFWGCFMKQSATEHFASKNPTDTPTTEGQMLFIWEDSCGFESCRTCTEGVGCALAGTRPGSGAAEIIPSTPCARGSTRLHNKRTAACLNTKHAITFVSSSTESRTARCACVRFKINVH